MYLDSESDLSLDFADIVPRKRLHTEPEQSQRNLEIENQVLINLASSYESEEEDSIVPNSLHAPDQSEVNSP